MLKLLTVLLLQPVWAVAAPHISHCPVPAPAHDSLIFPNSNNAQKNIARTRQGLLVVITAAGFGSSLYLLDKAWYHQYPKSTFHYFDDRREWLQMDKAGHAWTAYHLSRATSALWTWAGAKPEKAIWLGCATTLLYTTSIEWLDGHSAKWGWSWADVAANSAGCVLFASQQTLWQEQKASLKISVMPQRYTPDLNERGKQLFGNSLSERVLKDYNIQTYWLSLNLASISKNKNLPPWLNIAVGYGAHDMWGGFANKTYSEKGELSFDRSDLKRRRQWYLSPDIDFTRIKSDSKFVRTLFASLNCVKFSLPALMLDGGRLKFTALP